jgi:hypothetical protein
MTTRRIARVLLPFLALSMVGLAATPRDVIAQSAAVAASAQKGAVPYRCLVTTKDGRIEKTSVKAESEDAAKKAAVKKIVSRSAGSTDVSCSRSTESPVQSADSSAQKGGTKTRAPTPPVFAPRSAIEFGKDGSCWLSQEAAASRPGARDKCRELSSAEGGGFECPPDFCKTLR